MVPFLSETIITCRCAIYSNGSAVPLQLLCIYCFSTFLLFNTCRHWKNPAVYFSPLFRFLKFCSSVRYICVVSFNFSIWLQLFGFAPQPLMKATLVCFFFFFFFISVCLSSHYTFCNVFIQSSWSCRCLDDLLSSGFLMWVPSLSPGPVVLLHI